MGYNVIPKYSGGSPALVDEATARRVAWQEEQAFQRTIAGAYGPDAAAKAEARGLGNIVLRVIQSRGPRFVVTDIITGEHVERKTFVPRSGFDIFAKSPTDAKKGEEVRLRDGRHARLVCAARPGAITRWLVRPNEGGPAEEIDITTATDLELLRQKINA